jgi:excisionase family DNA binding protein
VEQKYLVDDDEASRLLGISRSKFHLLVSDGLIPRLKIGRTARYRREDLQRFIDTLTGASAGSTSGR